MSFAQRNITVTLVNFSVILLGYLLTLAWLITTDSFTPTNVFRLFGAVVLGAVLVTIIATILTHLGSAAVLTARTGQPPELDSFADERDVLIDLKGTRLTYLVGSLGSLSAMLSYVLGGPPLVMFSLLVASGLVAQVVGDVARLILYRRGL